MESVYGLPSYRPYLRAHTNLLKAKPKSPAKNKKKATKKSRIAAGFIQVLFSRQPFLRLSGKPAQGSGLTP
jgi:hypothetical protein